MNFDKIITSIDIGSDKIRTVIGSFLKEDKNNFFVLGVGEVITKSIRKGNILDMETFKDDLDKSLLEAEKMSGEQIESAYISFNSSSFDIILNKGVVVTGSEEITKEDIDRVLEMAKSGIDIPNKTILKIIPEYFTVDLESKVKNPIGMHARKIEVSAHIFTINSNILYNIKKALADVGIEILDIYPNLLTSPESTLTKRQKELGVVLIDIGASTTGMSVYEEGVLIHSAVIPFGGDNVTNDIALGARVSIEIAEKLKLEYMTLSLDSDKKISGVVKLSKISEIEDGEIDLDYLSKIATARYEEILEFINRELQSIGKEAMLPEGAIFVGGGVKAKGILELSKDILKLPSFIGKTQVNDELIDKKISDPSYAAIIGNMILANKYGDDYHRFTINFSGILDSIKKMFKKIMPN